LVLFGLEFAQHIGEAARVDVGLDEIIPTDSISFQFIFLGKALSHDQLRASTKDTDQSPLPAHEQLKKQCRPHFGNNLPEHVLLSDMRNFVRDSSGQFLRATDQFHEAGSYNDMSARQSERIRDWRFHNMKTELNLIGGQG